MMHSNDLNAKITVVIPCYNCEKSIEETLETLESQTFKDFSVLCVDDGSTDNTAELLKKWEKDARLNMKVVRQENGGVSRARNRGIEECNTEYIAFCDSDDLYHKRFIELLYNAIEGNKADTAYCRLTRNGETFGKVDAESVNVGIKDMTEAMNDLLYRMGEFSLCCYLFRTKILKDNVVFFDENTKHGEDREFNWKYLTHCGNAAYVDEILYYYRVNGDSATRRRSDWRKTDALFAIRRTEEYLKENGCPFYPELCGYLYDRVMWSIAKDFARSAKSDLFKRLRKEYDVRRSMKTTAKDKNRLVALSSKFYLVSPSLYYIVILIYEGFGHKK